MTYEMKVAGLTRNLPLCPISDTLMIGAFAGVFAGLIAQPQFSFSEIVTAMSTGFSQEFEEAALAKLLGREVATPEEARVILGLKQ